MCVCVCVCARARACVHMHVACNGSVPWSSKPSMQSSFRFKWTFSLIDISSNKRQQNQSLSDSLSVTSYFLTMNNSLLFSDEWLCAKPSQRANKDRDLLESLHPSACLAIHAFYRITGLSNRHLILCLGIVSMLKVLSLDWRPWLGHAKDWYSCIT